MPYKRIYADENGHSHFEMIIVPVTEQGISGSVSVPVETKNLLFKENIADYNRDLHNAPAKQFVVLLDGEIEITTSLDEVKRFSDGDVIFANVTTGYGHKTEMLCSASGNLCSLWFKNRVITKH